MSNPSCIFVIMIDSHRGFALIACYSWSSIAVLKSWRRLGGNGKRVADAFAKVS
jgi:hypothetical protein